MLECVTKSGCVLLNWLANQQHDDRVFWYFHNHRALINILWNALGVKQYLYFHNPILNSQMPLKILIWISHRSVALILMFWWCNIFKGKVVLFFLTFLCRAKPKREHIACCLREQACYWVDGLTADSFLHMGLLEDFNKLAIWWVTTWEFEKKFYTFNDTNCTYIRGRVLSVITYCMSITDIQNRPLMWFQLTIILIPFLSCLGSVGCVL